MTDAERIAGLEKLVRDLKRARRQGDNRETKRLGMLRSCQHRLIHQRQQLHELNQLWASAQRSIGELNQLRSHSATRDSLIIRLLAIVDSAADELQSFGDCVACDSDLCDHHAGRLGALYANVTYERQKLRNEESRNEEPR